MSQPVHNVAFRLKNIKEVNSFKSDELQTTNINEDDLSVEHLVKTIIKTDENQLQVLVGVRYLKRFTELYKLELLLCYELQNMSEVIQVDKENQKINIPKDLLFTFLSVAIGTLRGALYEKTKETSLSSYPLPMIPSEQLINSNSFML